MRRESSGIAYLILPSNMGYAEYVLYVKRTGTVSIIIDGNNVVHQCLITQTALNDAVFPQSSTELGSAVVWLTIEANNQIVVVGIVTKGDEISLQDDAKTFANSNSGGTASASLSLGQRGVATLITYNSASDKSQIQLNAQGDDGRIELISANISTGTSTQNHEVADQWQLRAATQQQQFSVTVSSEGIQLGGSQYSAVLGEQLIKQLQNLTLRVNVLFQAITAAPVVPADGGAAFKSSVVSAITGLTTEDYSNVTSQKVKLIE